MGKRVLLKLFDVLSGVISIIPAILAVGGFMASRLHPARYTELQWLGLFLPLILGINIVLALYWICRKKGWFIFPLLALLLNIPYFSGIIQWPFKRMDPAARELNVATYNIQHGTGGGLPATSREFAGFMYDEKIDILCLQEFPDAGEARMNLIAEICGFLPHYTVLSSSPQNMPIALFSKYPILQSQVIVFPVESKNTAMWADLDIDGQIIRIFNIHLQTTNLNQNRIGTPDNIDRATSRVIRLKDIMNENCVKRAVQADLVRIIMDDSPHPLIVCGDFNDTPASYAYGKIKGKLHDSFRSCGKGYGYTYKYLRKLLRIDYILYSPEMFRGVRYYSPELEYSDHKPVIVSLDLDPALYSPEVQNQK